MNNIKTLGIDLEKNSFSLVGMNAHGKVVLRKTLSRKSSSPLLHNSILASSPWKPALVLIIGPVSLNF